MASRIPALFGVAVDPRDDVRLAHFFLVVVKRKDLRIVRNLLVDD